MNTAQWIVNNGSKLAEKPLLSQSTNFSKVYLFHQNCHYCCLKHFEAHIKELQYDPKFLFCGDQRTGCCGYLSVWLKSKTVLTSQILIMLFNKKPTTTNIALKKLFSQKLFCHAFISGCIAQMKSVNKVQRIK